MILLYAFSSYEEALEENYNTDDVITLVMNPSDFDQNGKCTKTVTGLQTGKYYVLGEDESWSWRYEMVGDSPIGVTSMGEDKTVEITNDYTDDNWLTSGSTVNNTFARVAEGGGLQS